MLMQRKRSKIFDSVELLRLFTKSFSKIVISLLISIVIVSNLNAQSSVFLPFIDDFSSYTGEPNSVLWQESNVLVNRGYQYLPPTVGVATLDILDKSGKIYEQANIYGFVADTLCSVSVRLDSIKEPISKKLTLADSIWFSFFVQPTGAMGSLWERIGSAPSSKDSIILQFYASNQDTWTTVWSLRGTSVDSIYKNDSVYFLQYLIPLTDTMYYNRDFRFRFINYGSLDNNPSYSYIYNKGGWNIDYVYMNIGRNYKDSTYRDVAFVNPAKSLLKDFTALPAKHFKQEYMQDTIYNTIVNLHSATLNSNYSFSIKDDENNTIHSYSGGFENIVSYPQTHQFQTQKNHAAIKLGFSFAPSLDKYSQYTITHIVTEGVGQDNIKSNDTNRFVQRFENYFSYDDGTAESGIGIEPTNASKFAIGYPLLDWDTLYAVDIYFNCSWQQTNLKPFYLGVYDSKQVVTTHTDTLGKELSDTTIIPNNLLYETGKLTPEYDSLNKFHRYYLNEPVVLSEGQMFITLQSSSSTYLNVGFDQNNDASKYMFEKRGKDWYSIFLKGAPMIRLYFGYKTVSTEKIQANEEEIKLYPNPAKDYVNIERQSYDNKSVRIELYNSFGKVVFSQKEKLPYVLNISNLSNGVYVLRIDNQAKKLIIAK